MSITYRLRTLDGEDAGTFATTLSNWRPGMEFRAAGNRLYRIVAIENESHWWVEPVEYRTGPKEPLVESPRVT